VFDLTFQQVLARGIAAVFVFSMLGFTHALIARLLGDRNIEYDGKLTANPLIHLDLVGLFAAIVTRAGWVRPITVDDKIIGGRFAPAIAASGAAIATLAIGHLTQFLLPLVASYWPASSSGFVDWAIREIPQIAAWTVVLNVIPLPPLLGACVLKLVAPRTYTWLTKRQFWLGVAMLLLAILFYKALAQSPLQIFASILAFGVK
jgi:Zn-dependent protease